MSLSIIANWVTGETKTYTDITDIFNPFKNPLFSEGVQNLTPRKLYRLIKSVYTRENILSKPGFFFPGIFPTAISSTLALPMLKTAVERLIGMIDDEDLIALAWTTFEIDPWSQWHSSSGLTGPIGISSYLADGTTTSRVRYTVRLRDTYTRPVLGFENDALASEVKAKMKEIATSWSAILDVDSPLPYQTDNLLPMDPFTRLLTKMLIPDSPYVFDQSRNASSVRQILDNFQDDPSKLIIKQRRHDWGEEFFYTIQFNMALTKRSRGPIERQLNYSTDVCELLGGPLLDPKECNPVLYGLELEVSTNYTPKQLVWAADEPFFACKQDSSITGDKRYMHELVTRPMSLKTHKAQWAYFFSKLDYAEFDCSTLTNNGLHIHIDRKAFVNNLHLRKFSWFFTSPANYEFIFAMSERQESDLQRYAPIPKYGDGSKRTKSFIDTLRVNSGMRGTINLNKAATVEVRLFKGIVSYGSVLKNLEFVDAALHFTRDNSINNLSLRHFLNWMEKTPSNKYPVLKKFLFDINVDQYVTISDIKDVIVGETRPGIIANILSKADIKFNQEHADTLNRLVKRDVFKIGDGSKITLKAQFAPRVGLSDRELEARQLRRFA